MFNSEPGRASGAVVTGRKGGMFMRFEVTGSAAHSGANFEYGISAIQEIAQKIIALHALTDRDKGVTLNVGVIAGGQTVNTVAPSARGEVDLRFITPAQRAAAMEKVEEIIATSTVPGTRTTLEITGEFVPLVETDDGKMLYRALCRLRARPWPRNPAPSSRAVRRFRLCRGDRRADHLRSSVRSVARRTHRKSIWRSKQWCRARRRWLALAIAAPP